MAEDYTEEEVLDAAPVTEQAATFPLVKRFWDSWAYRHWRFFALGLSCMVLVAATTTSYTLLIKWVTDLLTTREAGFIWIIPLTLLTTLVRGGAFYFQNVITNVGVLRSLRDLQSNLFSHLMNADFEQLVRRAPGHITSRFTNDFVVIREMLWRSTTAVRDAITIVGLLAMMFFFDWALTLLVLVVYPIAAIPILKIGQRLRKASFNTQEHLGEVTAVLQESLSGSRMIKTYQLEGYERNRAANLFRQMYSLYMTIVRNRSLLDPFLEVIGGLAVGGVITVGGLRVVQGSITFGDLMGFISALLLVAPAVRSIGTLNSVLQEGLAAVSRTYQLLDEPAQIVDAPDASILDIREGQIDFRHVNFEYEDGNGILFDFSISVEAGKTVALVGPSGAGKSTVLNLIPRLYDISQGEIQIDGQDIRDVTIDSLRREIALVSQDIILFNDTVRANIALGRLDAEEDEIIQAAIAAAADDFIKELPQGYDTIVGDRGLKLSGGQRQRIAIARAILKDPKILLLDEATSALDAESELRVQAALEQLRQGRTTLVIAHRLSTVRNADKIYVMDEGHVREEGSHERLLATDGLYAKLSHLQFRDLDKDQIEDETEAQDIQIAEKDY